MMFKDAVTATINEKPARTENGMMARASTANKVLDFFSKVGSSRGVNLSSLFAEALAEDKELAIRALLWSRDIREGAGERQHFRNLIQVVEENDVALANDLMVLVPELGRWDDLFAFKDPQNRAEAFGFWKLAVTMKNGLAAKWAPREKSTKTKLAKELMTAWGVTPKQYRKMLVSATEVVETQMCAKEWKKINFSKVPSLASARYQKAFGRNAPMEYSKYLAELQKDPKDRDPSVKINAGAVYPYDVVKSVRKGNAGVANEQWKALPNYVGDSKIMPIVDVSGSMGCGVAPNSSITCMDVAISLGLYLSEKNTSCFKDVFMTFDTNPTFFNLKGTLSERVRAMERAPWGGTTDLHAAFNLLLRTAVAHEVPQEEMPEMLLILSDMQFNYCSRYDDRAIKMIERKYTEAGYTLPKIVFWNLNGRYENTPVRFDETGTCLVSGFSPTLLKTVLSADFEEFTPYNMMMKTLMSPRYDFA